MSFQIRDVSGNLICTNGEKRVFESRDKARAYRADYGIGGKIKEVEA